VLQCVAVSCTVLQCVAMGCSGYMTKKEYENRLADTRPKRRGILGTLLCNTLGNVCLLTFNEARGERSKLMTALFLARSTERSDGGAVKVALAKDSLPFVSALLLVSDQANHLESFFVGFRAGARIVDAVHTGHFRDDLLCKTC